VRWIKQVEGNLGQLQARQHAHEFAASQRVARKERGQLGHGFATESACSKVRVVVGRQHRIRREYGFTQVPDALGARSGRPDGAGESAQPVGRLWRSQLGQQTRRRHQSVAVRRHAARHHGLVDDGADAQRHVDAILDQVDPALGREDAEPDVRELLLESTQQRPPRLHRRRNGEAQAPFQARLIAAHRLRAFGQDLQPAAGVLVQARARIGQRDALGRALQQLDLQLLL